MLPLNFARHCHLFVENEVDQKFCSNYVFKLRQIHFCTYNHTTNKKLEIDTQIKQIFN